MHHDRGVMVQHPRPILIRLLEGMDLGNGVGLCLLSPSACVCVESWIREGGGLHPGGHGLLLNFP